MKNASGAKELLVLFGLLLPQKGMEPIGGLGHVNLQERQKTRVKEIEAGSTLSAMLSRHNP